MLEFPKNSLLRSKTSQRNLAGISPPNGGWLLHYKKLSDRTAPVLALPVGVRKRSAESKLPQCEIFQELIQPYYGATLGAIDSYQSRQVNQIANLDGLWIFRIQLDHLAARTNHLISSYADRVDDSFSWHG